MQAACFRFPKTSQPGTGAAEAPNHAEEPHMSSLKNEIKQIQICQRTGCQKNDSNNFGEHGDGYVTVTDDLCCFQVALERMCLAIGLTAKSGSFIGWPQNIIHGANTMHLVNDKRATKSRTRAEEQLHPTTSIPRRSGKGDLVLGIPGALW
jgi:hypothetical protein